VTVASEVDGPDPIARLRRRAWVEGVSLLLLVGVAVPLKHLAHLPAATRVMGLVHGLAFLMYGISIFEAWGAGALGARRAALALGAAVIPGGSFVFARTLHAGR
jgi:integral membrane protein